MLLQLKKDDFIGKFKGQLQITNKMVKYLRFMMFRSYNSHRQIMISRTEIIKNLYQNITKNKKYIKTKLIVIPLSKCNDSKNNIGKTFFILYSNNLAILETK